MYTVLSRCAVYGRSDDDDGDGGGGGGSASVTTTGELCLNSVSLSPV